MTTPYGAELTDVTVTYGRGNRALDEASFAIRPGTITGLLGRNGAGKSTALALLAALRRPTSGSVRVDGADPFENAVVMGGVQLVREAGDVIGDSSIDESLGYYSELRPHWDSEYAFALLDQFGIDPSATPNKLSRGKKSALGCTIGLASRAPLTIFDESYLGMDAPSRYAFYDALLEDYTEHPRTIVLSSHLIDEVERLFEDVVVLHHGRAVVAETADALRGRAVSLVGPTTAVSKLADGRHALATRSLGGTTQLTLEGSLEPSEIALARDAGVEIARVSIQDLFIHLTQETDPVSADPTRKAAR
ncbi:ABC transporter ATP-binding protein [Mumia zhuanghuii]|uniref:ATP-binding cassette domain-containing protein n=2 Tax=Mumia TaxID=1546255 RepID=A0ABW1QQT0_9ACTN|nr:MULTISPECIES: ABC transporter ATP-binding protein [Mumia]KAA1419988.1 ABC transporter ATP-binding protein [Mumia zhuanghuii]